MPIVWFAIVSLVVAGATWIGLVLAVALGSMGAEQLRKQHSFNPVLIELGLTILGPIGAVFFLLWLVVSGYAILIPSVLCAVAGAAGFFRVVRRDQLGSFEVAFSLGALSVGCTFILGANDVTSKVGNSIESIGIEYRPLARGGVWLAAVGISVLMFKLWERNVRRRDSERTKRMQNATYRKIEEEKRQLEQRINEIEDMQQYLENQEYMPDRKAIG